MEKLKENIIKILIAIKELIILKNYKKCFKEQICIRKKILNKLENKTCSHLKQKLRQ